MISQIHSWDNTVTNATGAAVFRVFLSDNIVFRNIGFNYNSALVQYSIYNDLTLWKMEKIEFLCCFIS